MSGPDAPDAPNRGDRTASGEPINAESDAKARVQGATQGDRP